MVVDFQNGERLTLSSLADEELYNLRLEIANEERQRVIDQIERCEWPEPEQLNGGVDDYVAYRDAMRKEGRNVSLTTSKYIVDYHRELFN